jgi:fumarylacetoacetase
MKGKSVFQGEYLNDFMSLSRPHWKEIRSTIQALFGNGSKLADNNELRTKAVHKVSDVQMHLPVKIGDYTDYYSSRSHAFNVGSIIRGPANALQENWVTMYFNLASYPYWLSWKSIIYCCKRKRRTKTKRPNES